MPRIVTLCNVFALQVNYLKCSKMISEGLRGLVRLQVPVLKQINEGVEGFTMDC